MAGGRAPTQDATILLGVRSVPEVRVVLAGVTPFLADLIRLVVAARVGAAHLKIEEFAGSDEGPGVAPDIVILGPNAASPWAGQIPPPPTRALRLSPDLDRLLGPSPTDSAPLTPEVLAERLIEIARTI